MSARPYSPLKYSYVPRDADEIDHLLYLLEQDLRSEGRSSPADRLTLLHAVMDDLKQAFRDHSNGAFTVETWSDYAYEASSRHVNDWAGRFASAVARLYALENAAEDAAKYGIGEGDPPFRSWPHWDEVRQILFEVALWLANFDLLDKESRVARRDEYVRKLEGVAKHAAIFRSGRPRGAIAGHIQFLLDLILDNPGRTAKEIAKLVREQQFNPDCPFYVDGEQDVFRDSGKTINLELAIENTRKRHIRSVR